MLKIIVVVWVMLTGISAAKADVSRYLEYFRVNMEAPLDVEKLLKSLDNIEPPQYDPGYDSRFNMDNSFKREFGQTIKLYGKSESRIKKYYEDDLLEVLSWMPKSAYQYIGPMLHEIPGMSEKILNMPGIKETKNRFPKDIDEKYKDIENLEYLSPALYVLLMPRDMREQQIQDTDAPVAEPARRPQKIKDIPAFLKIKAGIPVEPAKNPSPVENKAGKKPLPAVDTRTLFPTATSALTTKDARAVLESIDEVNDWGWKNNKENLTKLMMSDVVLDLWDKENGTDEVSRSLKDVVNPCQRMVLKIRLAGLYDDFSNVVAKQAFTPEEWAYTCDKAVKAFRVTQANHETAYAVRFHRRGYFRRYINRLPEKWRKQMQQTEAAIIAMYTVFKEDADAVRPLKNEFLQKLIKNNGMLLTAPVFY